jgi:streptomycin 6-kinase
MVEHWAEGFDSYLQSGDDQIPRDMVDDAHSGYVQLANSQRDVALLHGDLHHYNVLRDSTRGWLAIDPKGVVAEMAYEIGAVLRNPTERPDLFASPVVIEKRIRLFARVLPVDADRILRWAYAQTVLSAIWAIEDGGACPDHAIALATTLRRMLS